MALYYTWICLVLLFLSSMDTHHSIFLPSNTLHYYTLYSNFDSSVSHVDISDTSLPPLKDDSINFSEEILYVMILMVIWMQLSNYRYVYDDVLFITLIYYLSGRDYIFLIYYYSFMDPTHNFMFVYDMELIEPSHFLCFCMCPSPSHTIHMIHISNCLTVHVIFPPTKDISIFHVKDASKS